MVDEKFSEDDNRDNDNARDYSSDDDLPLSYHGKGNCDICNIYKKTEVISTTSA